ncbi:MAG: hypothetical protein SVM86_06125 [Candidatus Cloacimonadota bacterium]|nr:hypothetical protein [Candidatus Cloacimonadota bacterium]
MKRYGFLLMLIVFVIVSLWNFSHLYYEQKIGELEEELSSYYGNLSVIPMVVFSEKAAGLKALKQTIEEKKYINSITVENSSQVTQKLIKKYNLQEADLLKDKFELPNVMTIFFHPEHFNEENKNMLNRLILAMDENADINYNENLWQEIQEQTTSLSNKINFYRKINLPLHIVISLVSIFLITLFWVHFENKNNNYWTIFRKAGGNIKIRSLKFYSLGVMLIFLPIIVNILLNYFAIQKGDVIDFIEPRWFCLQAGTILFSGILTRSILGEKF